MGLEEMPVLDNSEEDPFLQLFQKPLIELTEVERAETLKSKFLMRYGEDDTPTTVLRIIQNQITFREEEFWLCFHLVYPGLSARLIALCDSMFNLLRLLSTGATELGILFGCSASAQVWRWPFQWVFAHTYQYTRWIEEKNAITEAISLVESHWVDFKSDFENLGPPIKKYHVERMSKNIDGLIKRLQKDVQDTEGKVAVIQAELLAEAKEEEARINAQKGIKHSSSWTSGAALPGRPGASRSRKPQENRYDPGHGSGNTAQADPSWISQTLHSFRTTMGEQYARRSTVILMAAFSVVATGLAAWKCSQPAPEDTPLVDSNFWSTLSSFFTGVAGLYCTIIPKLQSQEIKVGGPILKKIFYLLLVLSLLTVMAATISYLYHPQTSLILLAISTLAQLITTLMLIEGAVDKIVKDKDTIEYQEQYIADLGGNPRRR